MDGLSGLDADEHDDAGEVISIVDDGWDSSAAAWIADMGERGDFTRAVVLDGPMLERVSLRAFGRALDVGCGEGRFCRMLRERGIETVGIDPTDRLLAEARRRDPSGDYRYGRAEALDFPDGSFDLVVSYLTLIDVVDYRAAIAEMARVLRPGGAILVANLNGFDALVAGEDVSYLDERMAWVAWRGIRIANWHRPLSSYIGAFLANDLHLTYFDEPEPRGGDARAMEKYRRFPYTMVMEWKKPLEFTSA